MCRRLFIISLILFIAAPCFAETTVYFTNKPDLNLAWDANTEPDIAGYKLYYKVTGSTVPPVVIDIPGKVTTYVWKAAPIGAYDLNLTAYDLYGNESDFSATVQYKKKISKPGTITKIVVTNPNFTLIVP